MATLEAFAWGLGTGLVFALVVWLERNKLKARMQKEIDALGLKR